MHARPQCASWLELAWLNVLPQVKTAMVDSANDNIASLKAALAAARQDATRAAANAQQACAAAAEREAAATKRVSSLQCVHIGPSYQLSCVSQGAWHLPDF